MRFWGKIAIGLLLSSVAAILGCTREMGPKTTLKFSLPATGSFEKITELGLGSASIANWGLSAPSSFSEFNCYAVFVSIPEELQGQCVKSDGTIAFKADLMAGLYPAGSTVELDAPAGSKRTIRLVGLKSSSAAGCGVSIGSGLIAANYSAPFEVGKVTVDLAPKVVNNVTILASLTSSAQFHACSGGELGAFSPISSGGGATPPQPPALTAILTGLPNTESNALSLTATVSGADVVAYQYKVGPTPTTNCGVATGYSGDNPVGNTLTDSLAGFADGSLTLCVIGKNSVGTYQSLSQSTSFTWTKDTVNPNVNFSSPAPGSLVNLTNHMALPISGTCSEAGQSVVISGAGTTTASCVAGAWSANLNVSGATDGTISVQVDHVDLAGNMQSATLSLNKDTLPPTGMGLQIAGGASSTPTTSVTLNITGSDAFEMYITNDPSCTVGGTWEAFSAMRAWTLVGGATGTSQSVYLRLRDSSYNESACVNDTISYDTPALLTISDGPTFNFGAVAQGSISTVTLTVNNIGGFPATSMSGSGITSPFNFDGGAYPGGGTCGSTLAAGANCTMVVQFAPISNVNSNGVILLDYHDGVSAQQVSRNIQGQGFEPYIYMALGSQHSCAKTPDSTGRCWGANTNGQLGNNTTTDSLPPTPVTGGISWANLSSRSEHTCGVDTGNNGYCWGNNSDGQLGDNTTTQRLGPVPLSGGAVWQKIVTGLVHTCGLRTSGTIMCWGSNTYGQLGDGTIVQKLIPTAIANGGPFIDIAAGNYATCAINTSNQILCWGRGDSGELGNGTVTPINNPTPTQISISVSNYIKVTMGSNFTCAIRNSGGVVDCWGNGANGQLGHGATTNSVAGVVTPALSSINKIEAGDGSVCAYKSVTNEIYCWGLNSNGQLGIGSAINQSSPVSVGAGYMDVFVGRFHACGLTNFGGTRCWGQNTAGQLGTGNTTGQNSPIQINP